MANSLLLQTKRIVETLPVALCLVASRLTVSPSIHFSDENINSVIKPLQKSLANHFKTVVYMSEFSVLLIEFSCYLNQLLGRHIIKCNKHPVVFLTNGRVAIIGSNGSTPASRWHLNETDTPEWGVINSI